MIYLIVIKNYIGKHREGAGLRFGLSGLIRRVGERRSHS